jgi:hypothetical protein
MLPKIRSCDHRLKYVKQCCRSGSGPPFHFDADPDPDPTFHFDAGPDPDPSFQLKAQNIEKVLK